MLAFAVTRLVELHFCGFAVELDILCLPLANHNRVVQVTVDDNDEFLLGGLEEEVLNVAEENIDLDTTHVGITQTVLVDLNRTTDALALQGGTHEDVVKSVRSAVSYFDELVCSTTSSRSFFSCSLRTVSFFISVICATIVFILSVSLERKVKLRRK